MFEIWCRKDYLKMYTMPKWYKLPKVVFLNYLIVFAEGFWNRLKKVKFFSCFSSSFYKPMPIISGFAVSTIRHIILILLILFSLLRPVVSLWRIITQMALHVYFAGNLPIASCDNCCSRWYFTFNAAECSSPDRIDGAFYMATAAERAKTFTVTVTMKDSAITFTREKCEWEFGLETAIVAMHLLTRTQAEPQCPGSSKEEVARAQQQTSLSTHVQSNGDHARCQRNQLMQQAWLSKNEKDYIVKSTRKFCGVILFVGIKEMFINTFNNSNIGNKEINELVTIIHF